MFIRARVFCSEGEKDGRERERERERRREGEGERDADRFLIDG